MMVGRSVQARAVGSHDVARGELVVIQREGFPIARKLVLGAILVRRGKATSAGSAA